MAKVHWWRRRNARSREKFQKLEKSLLARPIVQILSDHVWLLSFSEDDFSGAEEDFGGLAERGPSTRTISALPRAATDHMISTDQSL